MKCELTVSKNSDRLILIFTGWSTDADLYRHITVENFDVMVVSEYSDLSFPQEIFDRYHTVCLFAWSLGVEAAAHVIPFEKVAMAIAINGTEKPVSDRFGIPVAIYNGTKENLNERNLLKFRRRMAAELFSQIADRLHDSDTSRLATELELISLRNSGNNPEQRWNRIYISSRDAIFPPENQYRYWQQQSYCPEIISLDAPHYVNLEDIVKACVPEPSRVGQRFRKALDSYSTNASAQRAIATQLAEMIKPEFYKTVIEIGPADGLFSRLWTPRLKPETIVYVDLFTIEKLGLAESEISEAADAEDWMAKEAKENPGKYDAIVTASSIQWFVNPIRFFENAFLLLRTGGLLACSTFLPGNLDELKCVNPFTLLYRSEEEIRRLLSGKFTILKMESDTLTLEFSSGRQTLSHLGKTGVGGSFKSIAAGKGNTADIPTRLTYRPLYFTAIKK